MHPTPLPPSPPASLHVPPSADLDGAFICELEGVTATMDAIAEAMGEEWSGFRTAKVAARIRALRTDPAAEAEIRAAVSS